MQFTLHFHPKNIKLQAASIKPASPSDLSSISSEYHDFADVFSKVKATTLPLHCDHDLKIDLEEGGSPPLSTIYSLSTSELQAL